MTTKEFLFSAWNWHPATLMACAAALVVYWAAWHADQRSKDRISKSEAGQKSVSGRVWLLPLALAIFLLTLVSPLDALADGYLFSAHMLQHLLLLLVVPPLLLLSWPARLRSSQVQNTSTGIPAFRILLAWLAGVGAMWLWHVPALCNVATSNQTVRGIQIVSLLVLGTLFWQPILGPQTSRRLSSLAGVIYLFTACVGCTLLGIIITFAPVSVCPIYMNPVDRLGMLPLIREGWGLTPSVDQQVGGLMMWVPACLIYLSGILGLLAHWYAAIEPEHKGAPLAAPAPKKIDPAMSPDSSIKQHAEVQSIVLKTPLTNSIKPNA